MKKIIALLMVFMMVFSFCACKNDNGENTGAENSVVSIKVGEVASTDLLDFTLEKSEFSFYASSNEKDFAKPVKSDEKYIASVGHTFVTMTFTVANKDRSGFVDIGDIFNGGWAFEWKAVYNGEEYPINTFDAEIKNGTPPLDLLHAATLKDANGKATPVNERSYKLNSGETVTIRAFGVIGVEVEDLKDSFELVVNVPNSKGENEIFSYSVK